jgi:hypothetical protein
MQMRYQLRHSPNLGVAVSPEGPVGNSRNLSQPVGLRLNRARQAGGVSVEIGTVRL